MSVHVHPDFYPKPVAPVSLGPGRWHFDNVVEGFLTEDEFVFLYDKCSEAIHEWNPFRTGPRHIDLQRSIAEWASRIERLLVFHYVRGPGRWFKEYLRVFYYCDISLPT